MTGDIHFHGPGSGPGAGPGSGGPTPRQLPSDVRDFVNRTGELDQLNAVLSDGTEAGSPLIISVYVIAGTAGAGKTSLALRWGHQVRDRFPDGQLHVNLRGYDPGSPVAPYEALHGFLTALGVRPEAVPRDVDAAAALYRSFLADRGMLVVLDNAATVGQVRPLLPGSAGCLTVVTSRSRLSGLAVRDGARRLTLGTLPQAEAVALLRAVTAGYRPEDDEEKLTELAQLCARLPLALRIAAERAASHPHLRLDDLIADLRDESALWDALSTGDGGEDGDGREDVDAVRTVFAWSYRALTDRAARLFRLLGLHPGPDFGLYAAAALVGQPPSRVRQLLDSLVGAHLLEQTAPDRYQFHDLLRAYATDQARREEPPEEREAALRRVLTWYLHSADAAQGWISPAERRLALGAPPEDVRPLSFADYDAAVDWAEQENVNLPQAVRASAEAPHRGPDAEQQNAWRQDGQWSDAQRALLTWQLAAVTWDAQAPSAPPGEWLEVAQLGLDAAGRLGDRAAEARLLTAMGMARTDAGEFAGSLACHERARQRWHELDDRLAEAQALNLMGLTMLRRRQLDVAAEHFERALALFRELPDAARWEATALSNLASAQLRAGRPAEAAPFIERALTAFRALGNEQGEGNALRLLSELRCEQGRTQEALSAAEDALDIAMRLRDHWREGYWLLTLGDAQRAAARAEDALASYHRSATLHRRLGNGEREALAWYGAGAAYHALERYGEAAAFHRQAATEHAELGDGWHEALALVALAEALVADGEAGAGLERAARASRLLDAYDDPRARAERERAARLLEPSGE